MDYDQNLTQEWLNSILGQNAAVQDVDTENDDDKPY